MWVPKVGYFRIFDNFLNFGKPYFYNHKSLGLKISIAVFRIKRSFDWYQFCYRIRGWAFLGTFVYRHLALAFEFPSLQYMPITIDRQCLQFSQLFACIFNLAVDCSAIRWCANTPLRYSIINSGHLFHRTNWWTLLYALENNEQSR